MRQCVRQEKPVHLIVGDGRRGFARVAGHRSTLAVEILLRAEIKVTACERPSTLQAFFGCAFWPIVPSTDIQASYQQGGQQ